MIANDTALEKMFSRLDHWKYANERYPTKAERQGRVAFLRAMQYKDIIEYECTSTDHRGSVDSYCVQFLRPEEGDEDVKLVEVPAPILKP